MSGICGVVRYGRAGTSDWIDPLRAAAPHREPQGAAAWAGHDAALCRQIRHDTPEAVRERQPRVDPTTGAVLVADARVDNRAELLQRLEVESPGGEPPTDADLLMGAWLRWGEEAWGRVVGDFAVALWDPRERRLHLARDPLAMRPLYWSRLPDGLAFGSEAVQVLAVEGVSGAVDEVSVACYLAGHFGELDRSFHRAVAQLPPAHRLTLDPDGVRVRRHWDLDPGRRIRYATDEEYAEHLRQLLQEAVAARLRSLRPVGVLLSGGVDSGTIAAVAGALLEAGRPDLAPVRGYSWAFRTLTQCDERDVSGRIAGRYGLPVTDVPAEDHPPLRDWTRHAPHRDEPLIGVYQPVLEESYRLAAGEGAGHVLSGERGDLTMGEGIYDYPALLLRGRLATLVRELRIQSRRQGRSLPAVARHHLWGPIRRGLWPDHRTPWLRDHIRRAYRAVRPPPPLRLPPWIRRELVARTELEGRIRRPTALPGPLSDARRRRYQAIFAAMHLKGVVWSERTQSRFGVGFADPWSDRRIAEFALAVPQRILNRTGEEKRLVRRALRGIAPDDVLARLAKVTPYPLYRKSLEAWARDELRDLTTDMETARRGWIQAAPLREHARAVAGGAADRPELWWALTLEMWVRRWDP